MMRIKLGNARNIEAFNEYKNIFFPFIQKLRRWNMGMAIGLFFYNKVVKDPPQIKI